MSEQVTARNNLAIENQKNDLAAKRLVIETQIAEVNARIALSEAQKQLDSLRQTPGADQGAIANAEQAVQNAQSNVGLATRNVQSAQENLTQQRSLAQIAERTLAAQQAGALAQQQAAEFARQQANQLTIVETKSKAISAGGYANFTDDDFRRINDPRIIPSSQAPISANDFRRASFAPISNIIRVSPATVQVNQSKPPDQLGALRDLIQLQRQAVTHLSAIASRRPVEKIEKNTTIVQNPVVRSNGGLPR